MKKILSVLMVLCIVLCLCSCEENTEYSTTRTDVEYWTDEETGVQYIIYSYSTGYSGMGGITPRLNEDGSLYVKEREGNG